MALAIAGCASRRRRTAPPISASAAAPRRRARRRTSPSMSATASSSTPTPRSIRADAQGDTVPPGAVAQPVRQLRHHHRGPCRRARHARIQSGARRPPRRRHARLPGRPRRRRQPPEDHLLRQGKAGRGLRRHLLLVAEPPRRHRAQRRRQLSAVRLTAQSAHCERRPCGPPFSLSRAAKQNLAEVSRPDKSAKRAIGADRTIPSIA